MDGILIDGDVMQAMGPWNCLSLENLYMVVLWSKSTFIHMSSSMWYHVPVLLHEGMTSLGEPILEHPRLLLLDDNKNWEGRNVMSLH